ncbi:MAG: tRNA 4-thiouridine(8) synthase ThiI [Clostridiaceae bacterium]|nr:tRNA 4-thiouridine(8) synthase ThiI [Oscillospiraceae bacterium]NLO63001.1 tRNA 4-thiouridine(8) synthase ThiI [Clostridiaceae bacterium]
MDNVQAQNVILARIGEIALKGLNRGRFEHQLIANIRFTLSEIGSFSVFQSQSRLWIEEREKSQNYLSDRDTLDSVIDALTKVFGLVSVSPAVKFTGGMKDILEMSVNFVAELLEKSSYQTFKVEAKRGNKQFPLNSPEICADVGGAILDAFPDLTVDVHNPDFVLYVEVRDCIYLYSRIIQGHRGLPVGTSGKGLLLLSGGIDSPVAGYMMASRGMNLDAVYFHAHPYTSDRAKEKVVQLARILRSYAGNINLHVVNFTEVQLELYKNSPQEMLTVTMRRIMIRIAESIAIQYDSKALITGESLGQVASQTLEALVLTDEVAGMPVFRPLIGLDKEYTTQIARRIGTYETSILPYEDCCTVFVAKHPQTRPKRDHIVNAEKNLDIDDLVQRGLASVEHIMI